MGYDTQSKEAKGVMIDLLFVEIGAVVTEIRGPNQCTIEPFCSMEKLPTYGAENRVEVDLGLLLEKVLNGSGSLITVGSAVQRALYDQMDNHRSPPIGPNWPGGGYEGVVSVRDDVVKANATLAGAVAALPGRSWEYQVVASIDEETRKVQRYHGFHAKLVTTEGDVLVLEVADAGKSEDPSSPRKTVRYNPADIETFYSGALVAENLVRAGWEPGNSGAVFIAAAALNDGGALPKLPPGLGE